MTTRPVTAGSLQSGSVTALRSTLDRRFWLIAGLATVGSLVVLGVPTAVIPNPYFIRMTPTETFNLVVWLTSAPLIGLLAATYVRPLGHAMSHRTTQDGAGRATVGGVAAFLAVGCPVCNKVVVAVLGVGGALSVFAPIQPLIGAASIGLLGATLAWRLRARALQCARCAA